MTTIPDEQSTLPFQEIGPAVTRQPSKRSVAKRVRTNAADPRLVAALENSDRVLFLDVETTGLSRHYDELTLVGWAFAGEYWVHVVGDDPAPLMRSLRAAQVIVTFNGTLFDLPFLRKTFADISLPNTHLDLRYVARRVGLTGGQKAIEGELGIRVREGVEDIEGSHAVLLWHRYLRGDLTSLRRLIDYNRSDVLAMRHILDEVVDRLVVSQDLWFGRPRFSIAPCAVSGWADAASELPPPSRVRRPSYSFDSIFAGSSAESATIVGIDLTGSESRPSGWCVLRGARAETAMIARDDEMIERIMAIGPALVSIDSPLSIPIGRTRVEDDDPTRETFGIMRQCERELKRRGINVYPCLLPSMQGLTKRGMHLATRLRALGIPVIESYPGAAQDIMEIPRKGAGEQLLKEGLAEFGLGGDFLTEAVRHDELDAITSALVGSFFLAGKYEALGGPSEDALIIPDLKAKPGPVVVGISGRICAGKTTAARSLERLGFAYTRFSQIVDDEIVKRGEVPDRDSRQRVGLEINKTKGQRWLCERVLAPVKDRSHIVVDGLRFPEDRAFFSEHFGTRFLHLHVTAPQRLRRKRYPKGPDDGPSFDQADTEPVEGKIEELGRLASHSIENSTTIDAFEKMVEKAVERLVRKDGEECRFPSS